MYRINEMNKWMGLNALNVMHMKNKEISIEAKMKYTTWYTNTEWFNFDRQR